MSARLMMLSTAVVAITAIVVGCGGSDESTAPSKPPVSDGVSTTVSTSSLSRAAFIEKASAACAREEKDLPQQEEEYVKEHVSKGQPFTVLYAKLAKAVLLPTIEAKIAVVRKLGAPKGDQEELETIVATQQAGVDEVREVSKVRHDEELEAIFAKASKEFEDYGLAVCGYVTP